MYKVNLDKYWFEDGLYEESVDEFIISAGGYDDESSSESDTSSDIEDSDLDLFFVPVFILLTSMLYCCFTFIYIYIYIICLHFCLNLARIREYGSTLYVGLAHATH